MYVNQEEEEEEEESADLGERERKRKRHTSTKERRRKDLSSQGFQAMQEKGKNKVTKKVNSWRIQQFGRRRTHSSFGCFLHRVRSEDFLSPSFSFFALFHF